MLRYFINLVLSSYAMRNRQFMRDIMIDIVNEVSLSFGIEVLNCGLR